MADKIPASRIEIAACTGVAQNMRAWLAPAGIVIPFEMLMAMSEMQVPRDRDERIDMTVMRQMAEELSDLPNHILEIACKEHRRKSSFFPTVNDLRTIAETNIGNKRLMLARAEAIARRGYVPDPEPPRLPASRESVAYVACLVKSAGNRTRVEIIADARLMLEDPSYEPNRRSCPDDLPEA